MPGFSIEHEGVERRLVYRLEADEYIDAFGYEMVHDNEIDGLLPIIAGGRNGIEEIKYDLQSMMPLRAYLDSSMSKKRLLELFRGVISIIQCTSMYLLDSSMLVFSLDSIFIKSNPLSINMVYLPVVRSDMVHDITELLRTLFRAVIISARFIVEQDNSYITEILNALNSEQDFTVQGFKSLIDRLDIEVHRHYINEVSHSSVEYSGEIMNNTGTADSNNLHSSDTRTDYMYAASSEESVNIIHRFTNLFKNIFGRRNTTTNMLVDGDVESGFYDSCVSRVHISDKYVDNRVDNNISLYEVNDIPAYVREGVDNSYTTKDTVMLSRSPKEEGIPYITRVSTGENIGLDKHVFRIGKEERYADYLISNNAAVSRVHAEFTIKNGICCLVDEDSLNHTYVNDKMLDAHVPEELKSGDVIRFADEEFIFYS